MPASEPARVPANEINAIRIWSVKKITSHLQAQKKEKLHCLVQFLRNFFIFIFIITLQKAIQIVQ